MAVAIVACRFGCMKYCFVFFLLFATYGLLGQETRYGIKTGLNYSTIIGDQTEGINPRLSGHLGVFAEIRFSDRFAFQPEVVYSSQGFQFNTDLFVIDRQDPTLGGADFKTAVQLNYLTVPILADFAILEHLSIQVGPQFGFLLNQVTKLKNFDGVDSTDLDDRQVVNGRFQLDYGVAAGVAYKLTDQWALSGRIYQGIRNRLNGSLGDLQNYNTSIQLSVNYLFR